MDTLGIAYTCVCNVLFFLFLFLCIHDILGNYFDHIMYVLSISIYLSIFMYLNTDHGV